MEGSLPEALCKGEGSPERHCGPTCGQNGQPVGLKRHYVFGTGPNLGIESLKVCGGVACP